MGAVASARLLAVGATWRLTGLAAAGDGLVRAATTGGETEQQLAGMLLVRGGNRSVPVVTEAILSGRAAAAVLVDVLASIDTADARAALLRVSQAPPADVPPETRDAAAEALRTIGRIRDGEGGRS